MLFHNRRSWSLALVLIVVLFVSSACTASKPVDLFGLVRSGDVQAVKAALEAGADANSLDNWGRTPLVVALQGGKTPVAEVLVAKGANVILTDAWGRTPLLVAVQLRNTSAVRLLLDKGSDVNAANKNDITPLIAAAQTGNRDAAGLLIAKGALVDTQDNLGWTALMWAANRNDGEIVKMLLAKGADAGKVGRDSATALELAKRCGADASLISALAEKAPAAAATSGATTADCDKPSAATVAKTELIKPNIDPARIFRGKADAPVTIVEYTDFQCPYCGYGAKAVEEVMAKYEGQVKLVVKHFPLPFHPVAMPSALYFEAITLQSPEKAWQFYDRLFADLRQLSGGEAYLQKVASDIGVDMKRLEEDVRSMSTYARIAADLKEVEQFKFDGVPVFVINGKVLMGAQPPQKFFDIIDAALRR